MDYTFEQQFYNHLEYLTDCYESWRDVPDEERLETYVKYSHTAIGAKMYLNAFKRSDSQLILDDLADCAGRGAIAVDPEDKANIKEEMQDILLDILDPQLFLVIEREFNELRDEYIDDLEPGLYSQWRNDDPADRMSNFEMW